MSDEPITPSAPGPWDVAKGAAEPGPAPRIGGPDQDADAQGGPRGIAKGVGTFGGSGRRLAGLMFGGVLLTVLTLGFYRFWLRTDLRRYYWNSIRIDGEPFEYTGRALEMFLGFLIAIFFLAIYLFLISAALSAWSLAVWQNLEAALFLPLLAVVPLVPFAKYRAQRYLLSRTRFRGIRFGLEPGAWAYAGRSLLWNAGVILTLGLLWPVADFYLRRFVTQRTYFGDQRMSLEGKPAHLVRRFFTVFVLPIFAGAILVALSLGSSIDGGMSDEQIGAAVGLPLTLLAIIGLFCWSLYHGYRLRFFLNRTHVGEDLILSSALSPGGLMWRAVSGYFLTGLILIIFIFGMVLLLGFAATTFGSLGFDFPDFPMGPGADGGPLTNEDFLRLAPVFLLGLLFYLTVYVVASAVSEVLVSRRVASHIASTLHIEHFDKIVGVRQREEDHSRSADGFADALDVGPI